jgi:hypothetical protein
MNITVFFVFILLLATGGITVPAELCKIWRGVAVGPSMNLKLIIRDSLGNSLTVVAGKQSLSDESCLNLFAVGMNLREKEKNNPRCSFDFPGKHGGLMSREVQLETRLVVL